HLLLYPVRVQGEGAAEEIVEALRYFGRPRTVDVVILARGGGSLEDLWEFNQEMVARAIAASPVPVITGVGHETDSTIADFVADLRAPTPSAAAELVIKSKEELKERLRALEGKLAQQLRYRILHARQGLTELLAARGWRRLEGIVREQAQRADELATRLRQELRDALVEARQRWALAGSRLVSLDLGGWLERSRLRLEEKRRALATQLHIRLLEQRKRLEGLAGQLNQLSPLRVLERGYAIVFDPSGAVLKSSARVQVSDSIAIQLARGRLEAEVKKKEK
ncbi:MAG: exodeoxyribonuclease VII large subunit, partial [Terriglobia bacterium]